MRDDLKFTRKPRKTVAQNCPCGKSNKDGKFTPYEGYTDCGFCHSCGETFLPESKKETITSPLIQQPVSEIKYVPKEEFQESLSVTHRLTGFISGMFGIDATAEAMAKYQVGGSDGSTVFWMIDTRGRVRSSKIMKYGEDGHRTGDIYAPYTISNGYKPVLFGSHLLTRKAQTVFVVESEKTAVIASILWPKYTWVATGGANGLTREKAVELFGQHVIILPDADESGRLGADKGVKILESLKINSKVLDLFREVSDGFDLADWIKRNILDDHEIRFMSAQLSEAANKLRGGELDYEKGVFRFRDYKEQMIQSFMKGQNKGEYCEWKPLSPYFTWKRGMIYLWTGYPNHGKSEFLFHLMLLKSVADKSKWIIYPPENLTVDDNGDLTPEEIGNTLIHSLVGKTTDKDLPGCMSKMEYERGIDFIDQHFTIIYPDSYKTSPKDCLDHVTYVLDEHRSKDNLGIVIDPWNKLYQKYDGLLDEYIASQLAMIKAFSIKNNVVMNIVVHPKAPGNRDNIPAPSAYDLRGGAMWNNGADGIFSIHRPDFFTDVMPDGSSGRNSTRVSFNTLKMKNQKLMGITGSVSLEFDRRSNRYKTLDGKSPFNTATVVQTELPQGSWSPLSKHPDEVPF